MSDPVPARYYANPGAAPHSVILARVDRVIFVAGSGISRSAPLEVVRTVTRPRGPAVLTFSDGAYCEADDREAFARVLQLDAHTAAGQWEGIPWRLGLVTAVFIVLLAAGWRYGIPALAGRVAAAVPEEVSRSISDQTLALLDAEMLQPSRIPDERQRQIAAAFERLLHAGGEEAPAYRLVFRASEALGANAMALPSGTIVVTDALVELAHHDEELLGVLAHEAGHVDHRHGLRLAVQRSAAATTIGWITGELGSIIAAAPTALINAKYSRDFEREADAYAADLLLARGIRPAVLADMLEQLDAYEQQRTGAAGDAGLLDYLATHPATDERLAFLRTR